MMQELEREAWEKIAERIGIAADGLESLINAMEQGGEFFGKLDEEMESLEEERLLEWRELVKAMRYGVAAVLYVGEFAAERCRFEMLDAHPPDQDQGMQDNRYDRKGEDHHEGL